MPETAQLPPDQLSGRIGGPTESYDDIGKAHRAGIENSLPSDWTWAGKRVLDFGCGTGRTLAQFANEAEDGEFWGCDIHEPSITWAKQNMSPPFSFVTNNEAPPLEFQSEYFDFIFGMSVFTHLAQSWAEWLLEIRRILKPGGLALFTFLGAGMAKEVTDREWVEDKTGMIPLDVGRPWDMGGPNVLQSEWWLRSHWGRAFEILSVHEFGKSDPPVGHGLILIRRDDRPAPSVAELKKVDPNEPREVQALQYSIEVLQERSEYIWTRWRELSDQLTGA